MIGKPSCSQLVTSVRQELERSVKPAVSDPQVLGALAMVDSILASVARRCDDQVAWMQQEIGQIEEAAELVLGSDAPTDQVSEALAALRAGRAASNSVADVHAEYDLATELLSRSLEAAFEADPKVRAQVEQVLDARLAREVEIRGEFSLVGRD